MAQKYKKKTICAILDIKKLFFAKIFAYVKK